MTENATAPHIAPDTRRAAQQFADKWATETREKQKAYSFWTDFFTNIVGVPDVTAAGIEFEHTVRTARGTTGFIDALWPGVVLVEHKSADKDLDEAEAQAREYLARLPRDKKAPFILISDFARFRIIHAELNTKHEFRTENLTDNLERVLAVFSDYTARATRHEVAADRKAAEKMARFYTTLEAAGYEGHEVSIFLNRILFLLFGDDAGMWGRPGAFEELVAAEPADGHTLGSVLGDLFLHLNDPRPPANIPESYKPFPYVNGGLFAEHIRNFRFTQEMRDALLDACRYSWADISPAIFGAIFQEVKSKADRRKLGEHYTSEADIMKVIRPLFLDEFEEKMRKAWHSAAALNRLREEMGQKVFLDPACGAGNFLIVTYKALRALELKVIVRTQELTGQSGSVALDGLGNTATVVTLSQFHGFEWNEWSAEIAKVAMFMADRQADIAMEQILGSSPARFPISDAAHIHTGSALSFEWASKVPMGDNTVIFGNPPYIGSTWLSAEQRQEHNAVWKGVKAAGILDFVASWFLLSAKALTGTAGRAAFVSTNSICQGQQTPVLWGELGRLGFGIDFAHRSFAWNNSGGAEAAVTVIIVGFSANEKQAKRSLWSYDKQGRNGVEQKVSRINAYLLDAPEVLVTARTKPLTAGVEEMTYGSKPTDGGQLSNITPDEADLIRATDATAASYLRRVIGAKELTNGEERYGLWLKGAEPADIRNSPALRKRVTAVREMRLASSKATTRRAADRSSEWDEVRHRAEDFIAIPLTTTAARTYIPMGKFDGTQFIANNKVSVIYGGSAYSFGVLSSRAFVLWTHAVSGRLGEAPNISNTITYNNLPLPTENADAIAVAAEQVLSVRKHYPTSSLADLYDDLSMPADLRKAHKALDAAVVKGYGLPAGTSEEALLEHLFTRYAELTEAKQAA